MKKILLVFTLALILISGFATVALADQSHMTNPGTAYTNTDQDKHIWLQQENGQNVPIHSGYTVNTDACASCHSVHQAKDQDRMLLQWASPTEACMACHDGTITATYDVEHGKIAATGGLTNGGLFGTMANGVSASQHDVHSSVTLSKGSVPGGKRSSDVDTVKDSKGKLIGTDGWGNWDGSDFECSSCHEPHGNGGNPRLLQPNPNGAMKAITKAQLNLNNGVYKFSGVTISTTTGVTTMGTDPATNTTTAVTASFLTGKKLPLMTPKFFDANGTEVTTHVTILVTNDGSGTLNSKDAVVTWSDGTAAPNKIFTDYTPVLQVAMEFLDNSKYTTTETIKYGAGMQDFCAACHTDYYGARGNSRAYNTTNQHHNGAISRAGYNELGNQNGSDGSCLTCHYAHGVDQSRWNATQTVNGATPWAGATENAGSSALKRLPNMGTCEVCHAWEAKSYNTTNNLILQNTLDATGKGSLRYQVIKP